MNRPEIRLIRLFPAVLVLALLAGGCDISVGEHGFSMDVAAGKATDEWTRSYTVSPGGQLEIANINGVINASPGDGPRLEIRAERIAKASTDEKAQELLKKIEIVEEASANKVRLETRVPKMSWQRSGHEVRYWVKVPKGLAVNFETVNGGVRLENLDGQIVASTTNGGVRGTGLRGHVKASTTNGGVQIEMASVTDEVELATTNGGIRLQLPRDAKANLDARCVNGGIGVSDFDVDGEQTRRRVNGTINGGGPRISVETTNGGVRISSSGERSESH
jgi:DUF4097 and DUF4098 domain-containing protein YvlB